MNNVRWECFPLVGQHPTGRAWLQIQADERRAPNTVDAYGRALEDYLTFCLRHDLDPDQATRTDIAAYIHDLTKRPKPHATPIHALDSGVGLSNATLQQRITAVRLYFDYLVEQQLRVDNCIGRGRFTPGRGFGGQRDRALIPRYHKLPWIPTDEQWQAIVDVARGEPVRNRFMLALAYDAALRREELCALQTDDVHPGQRLVRVRAETTKTGRERMVPYSGSTAALYLAYLQARRTLSHARGRLFLSESRRNHAQPISIWTWSKVVHSLALQADVPRFTTHTFRHLRLTDLARAGLDLHDIAQFAGHRNIQTTLLYIQLSGRDLATKVERGMARLHLRRAELLQELLV